MDPILTREQVRQIDRIAIEELGIPGVVLMENAGRNAADHIARLVTETGAARVIIFCGPGNNGGDGFVIARQLANRAIPIVVCLAGDPDRMSPDCNTNYQIVRKMGFEVTTIDGPDAAAKATAVLRKGDIAVDALLGTGFSGQVRSPLDAVIRGINQADKTLTVAVDVPSGMDCDTGQPANATIRADHTLTFAAGKIGFTETAAAPYVGRVTVYDIGAPPALIERLRPTDRVRETP
ncbi:MAG TPA: NAD(P)H-hydrate epimerase [Phycisphaerae bacterium]|nr:NAD(P)H-hydrate epimerase [Phycisphaerae bacterium]